MIHLYYTFFNEPLPEKQLRTLLAGLPKEQAARVQRYKMWKSLHASLFGKLLLKQGLHDLFGNKYELKDIQYDSNNRPNIDGVADFSISHSGNCVVCAVAEGVILGADIEQIRTVNITGLSQKILSPSEYTLFKTATNKQNFFFEHWTQKEAVVKAKGIGLRVALNTIVIENGRCKMDGETWYIQKPSIAAGYISHIACNSPVKANLKQLSF